MGQRVDCESAVRGSILSYRGLYRSDGTDLWDRRGDSECILVDLDPGQVSLRQMAVQRSGGDDGEIGEQAERRTTACGDNHYSASEWLALIQCCYRQETGMDRLGAMVTLVRVIDTGSFSAAARQLNIGQPAISKTIAQLEDRLGVRLLTRSTRGLTPTEAGLRFYERARRSIEKADEAEIAARGEGAGLAGTLRIAAATTFARLHVVRLLPAFLAQHPRLIVELILDDRVVDLVEEGIDVSLRMGDLPDSSATARRLGSSPRAVLATCAYLDRAGTPRTPSDLAEHDSIIYTQGRSSTWRFRRDGTEVSVAVTGRLRVNSAEGIRAAVLADMGLTIASHWMFAPELASGQVSIVLADWTLDPIDLWAVFPTGRLVSAKARAFTDMIGVAMRNETG
ncbi:LysR family transcriptional regulator [Skermanella mucosa]|uniref:LysR family transcriptional regulator n=1 Tax=Skermanella mucosa TaxID=1789672 RepID=UPI002B214DD9|nr:LysR family transcriptional regulator [Skermanella mucosa]